VVDPCDAVDIEQAVPQIARTRARCTCGSCAGSVPVVLDEIEGYRFELGKARMLREAPTCW
jgi:transketolase